MTEGNNPLLTESQRDRLRTIAERGIDGSDSAEVMSRKRIRDRVHHVLTEFPFLLHHMPKRDRRQAIESPLDEYRKHPGTENGDKSPGLSSEAQSGKELYDGIAGTLAFLYASVDDQAIFEEMVEDAIRDAREVDLHVPADVEVSITIKRD